MEAKAKNIYSSATLVGNFNEDRAESGYRAQTRVRLPSYESQHFRSTYQSTIASTAAAHSRPTASKLSPIDPNAQVPAFPGHQVSTSTSEDRLTETRRQYVPPNTSQTIDGPPLGRTLANNPGMLNEIRERWTHQDSYTRSLYTKKV